MSYNVAEDETDVLRSLQAIRGRSALLGRLDDAQLAALAEKATRIAFAAGETLLREQDREDGVYLLLDGRAEVLGGGADEAQQLALVEPGDLVGEVAYFFGGRRTSQVRALTGVELARFSSEVFAELLANVPELAREVSAEVLARLRRSLLATHLSRLFGSLSAELLTDLESRTQWLTLGGGEVLFRQGDLADRAYIVLSGRLRVCVRDADGRSRRVNEVGRSETLGEMALLAEGTRSGTVHAQRDTYLAAFTREDFAALVAKRPEAMMPVTHLVLRRLQDDERFRSARPRVATIAIVGASPHQDLGDFARRFTGALGRFGPVDSLSSSAVDERLHERGIAQSTEGDVGSLRLVPWLLEREERVRFLVYEADSVWSAWTERCVRQADHVIVVADAEADARPGEVEAALARRRTEVSGCPVTLVLLRRSARPAGTARWLATRDVDQHVHARRDSDEDFARLARLVTGNALGLVLGGGGARGFAHIGVLRALRELDVTVDMIGGTSMGAIIAGLFALGHGVDEIDAICRRSFVKLLDYTFPAVSLLRGQRIGARCREILGEHLIEDLAIPYFAVSTNLTRAESVVHRRGGLQHAVRASISIPGVLPPVHDGTDLLIDGGILNNVPDDVMRHASGGGPVIAVDVSQKEELTAVPGSASELSGWDVLWRRFSPFSQPADTPGILSLLQRAIEVRGVATRRRARPECDLYLQLPLSEWGLLQFDALDDVARRGYEMARDRIAKWHETRSRNHPIVPD